MEDTRKFVATVNAHHTCTTIKNTRNKGLVPHWPFNLTHSIQPIQYNPFNISRSTYNPFNLCPIRPILTHLT